MRAGRCPSPLFRTAAVLILFVSAPSPFPGRERALPGGRLAALGLEAESAVLIDSGDGEILFEKNAHARMYPASTTKILTALLAIEAGCLGDKVSVGNEIRRIPPDASRAGLRVGETIGMKDLLRGLLLPSGNDAAQAIAVHVARVQTGRRSLPAAEALAAFVGLMNGRAKRCGAVDSHFINPDGYHHPDHFSSAHDLALIAREAMRHAFFRETVGREAYRRTGVQAVPAAAATAPLLWENRNKLLDRRSPFHFAGATGIKTGHTGRAGYCHVASASRNGRDVIAVVLKSTEDAVWTDSIRLLSLGLRLSQVEGSALGFNPRAPRALTPSGR